MGAGIMGALSGVGGNIAVTHYFGGLYGTNGTIAISTGGSGSTGTGTLVSFGSTIYFSGTYTASGNSVSLVGYDANGDGVFDDDELREVNLDDSSSDPDLLAANQQALGYITAALEEMDAATEVLFDKVGKITVGDLIKVLKHAGSAGDGISLGIAAASGDQDAMLEAIGDLVIGAVVSGAVTLVTGSPMAGAGAGMTAAELFSLPGVIDAVTQAGDTFAAAAYIFALNGGEGVSHQNTPDINPMDNNNQPWDYEQFIEDY